MKTYSKCTVSLNLVAVSVVDWARLGGVNISLDLNTGHCPGHLDTSLPLAGKNIGKWRFARVFR